MGTKCEMWLLLPSLFKRKKQRHQFRRYFENVSNDLLQNEQIVKIIFHKIYTMEVYCVKEKRHTPNVQESEKVVITKNNRKLLKVQCASYGITKTRFMPGN